MKTLRRVSVVKKILFFLTVLITFSCSTGNREMAVSNLRCEYLENPLGVDIQNPRFSWNIIAGERGIMQSAYRILISDNRNALMKETGNIWDSGKVSSEMTCNISYDGVPLKSGATYFWSVSIWNQNGEQSSWAEPAFFSTGLLNRTDWKAQWISAGDTLSEAPLLRTEFTVEKRIQKAFAYVTGLGYYELYLNGEKVGDHVLDPCMTDYRKRILYSTFDVTENLKTGLNVAGAFLGKGALNLKQIENRYSWTSRVGRPYMSLRFLMQLEIMFSDGTIQRVITDDSWRSSASPVTFNNLYGGEDYDARLEKTGWSAAGYDASGWDRVKITDSPGGILQSQLMPPIRVTATLIPVAETKPGEGVYLFDMGQNFAGWWRIRVEGEEGVKIRIRGAETLNDSLFS